ncbi:MAG: AlpA family transcriptional regulator [Colwellia sp.]
MKKREKAYLKYYLEQLTITLKNNISQMQQSLSHIADITKNINEESPDVISKPVFHSPLSTDKLAEKPPECLIRIKEVCLLVGVSRSTIYKLINEGRFPSPVNFGPRFKAWQKQTILDWIKSLSD